MKPRFRRAPFLAALLPLTLMAASAQAQTTYTRQNNTTLLNTAGAWLPGGGPPTGSDIAKWDSTNTGQLSTALGGSVTWGQVLVASNAAGAISIGNTAGAVLTLSGVSGVGVDMSAANQNLTINNNITVGADQTWNVNSGRILSIGAATAYNINTTDFTLTKTGLGMLEIRSSTFTSSTGNLAINGGRVLYNGGNSIPSGNLSINGGFLEDYFVGTGFSRALGTGAGAVQLPGGVSGFSESGNNAYWTVSLGASIQWNNGAGTFSPTELLLNGASAQSQNGSGVSRNGGVTFSSNIDLNGGTRTIRVDQVDGGTGGILNSAIAGLGAQATGNLTDSVGSGGALTKTGVGRLILSPATGNTFTGGTTINQGLLRFTKLTAMPASGTVAVQTGGIIGISVGVGSDWTTTAGTGNGTIGGLLAGSGGQSGSAVSYAGDVGLELHTTSTPTYSGSIANPSGSTSLSLYRNGTGTFTLSGSSSYTGPTTLYAGSLAVPTVAAAGANSPMGAYPTAGAGGLFLYGGTFQYTGGTASTDRGFTQGYGGAKSTINVSGTAGTTLTMGAFAINSSQGTYGDLNITGTAGNSLVLGNCTLNNNQSLFINPSIPVTINGTVGAGSGGLTLGAAGGLTINGACNFTGATAINAGALRVLTGSGNRYTAAITVANTAGCVFGVQLAAANGQWTNTGNFTVGGANSEINIDYASTAPGTSTDPIKVANLTVSGRGAVRILNPSGLTAG